MHCQKLGQKDDLVIKVSQSNEIAKVKNRWQRQMESMTSISKHSFSYIIIHFLFTKIRGHYLFPLWSRQIHFDGGGIAYFTPDHDSGFSLAT